MRVSGRLRGLFARTGFAVATALVLGLALREVGPRVALRAGPSSGAIDPVLEGDVPLRLARARARLAAGELSDARTECLAALARRPRDPELLLALADASSAVGEQLRLAAAAAREAPYEVASAEFAFSVAFEAVEVRASRAAAARETAARLRAAGVTEGVADAVAEAERLEGEMRTYLGLALDTHAATSPTARGMRFLEDARERATRLAAELRAP